MRARRLFFWTLLGLVFAQALVAHANRWDEAPRVLIYTPEGVTAPAEEAALSLGYAPVRVKTPGAFQQAFEADGPWDLIVVDHADQVTPFPETLADAVYLQATSARAAITTYSAWERVNREARDRAGIGAVQFLRVLEPDILRGGAPRVPHDFAESLTWPDARSGDFVTIARDAPAQDTFLTLSGARITEDDAPTLGAVSFRALDGFAIHNVLRRASFGAEADDPYRGWRDLYRAQMRWLLGDAYLLDASTAALLQGGSPTLNGAAVHVLSSADDLLSLTLQVARARGIALSFEESVSSEVRAALRAALRAGAPVVASAPPQALEALIHSLTDATLEVETRPSDGVLEPAASGASRRFFVRPNLLVGLTLDLTLFGAFASSPSEWTTLAALDDHPAVLRWDAGPLVVVGAPLDAVDPVWGRAWVENLFANTREGDQPVLVLSETERDLAGLSVAMEERGREALMFSDVEAWLAAAELENRPWLVVATENRATLEALEERADEVALLLEEGARLDLWSASLQVIPSVVGGRPIASATGAVERVPHLDRRWHALLVDSPASPPRPAGAVDALAGTTRTLDALPWLRTPEGLVVAWAETDVALSVAGWAPELGLSETGERWLERLLVAQDSAPALNVIGANDPAWDVVREAAARAGLRPVRLTQTSDWGSAVVSETPLLLVIDLDTPNDELWNVPDQRARQRQATVVWTSSTADPTALGQALGMDLDTQSLQRWVLPRASTQTTALGFEAPWPLSSPLDVPSATAVVSINGQSLLAANTDLGRMAGGLRADGRLGFMGAPRSAFVEEDARQAFANLLVASLRVPRARIVAPVATPEGVDLELNTTEVLDRFGEPLSFQWTSPGSGVLGTEATLHLDGASLEGPADLDVLLEIRNASGLRFQTAVRILVENVAPEVTLQAPSVVEQGDDLEVEIHVRDVANDLAGMQVTVDFGDGAQATASPTDDPEVWTARHTYQALGRWVVTATAIDLDGAVGVDAVEVEMKNVPPIVEVTSPGPLLEGSTGVFRATAVDPGGGPVTLTWTFGPAPGVKRMGDEVEHAFGRSGVFLVELLAEDEDGGETRVHLQQPVINVPPRFTSLPPTEVREGDTLVYSATFVDPGFDNVHTFELLAGPASMTVSQTGEVRWTAEVMDYLPIPVTLRVRDEAGGQDTQSWMLEVQGVDSSGGGAPDACKVRWGLDPDDPSDEALDLTGDGLTVAEACRWGRSPVDFSGPGAPELVSPIDDETWFRDELVFTWMNALPWPQGQNTAPLFYEVELYGSETSTTPLLRWEQVPEEAGRTRFELDPPPPLGEDLRLWWRVRGVDPIAVGKWSEREAFLLNRDNRAPGRPTIVGPRRSASANPPLLRWMPTTDPDGDRLTYEVEVGLRRLDLPPEDEEDPDENGLEESPQSPLDRVFHLPRLEPESAGVIEVEMPEPLDPDEEYFFRVRAWDHLQPGPFDLASFRIELNNRAPPAPTILGPPDARPWLTAENLSLVWSAVEDPDGDPVTYELQLARDGSFSEVLESVQRITLGTEEEGRYALPEELGTGRFHWRVRASDGLAESPWAASTFRRVERNTPPTAPQPLLPAQDDRSAVGPVILVVRNATSPDDRLRTYQFQIAEDAAFRQLVASKNDVAEGGEETSADMGTLPAGTYMWRARAYDGLDVGPWSSTRRFHREGPDTSEPEDPENPDLPSPEPDEPGAGRGSSGGCSLVMRPELPGFGGQWTALLALGVLVWRRRRTPWVSM